MKPRACAAAWMIGIAVASTALGCGGGGGAKFADVKVGEMPANETWDGVYYNPVYGYLHLIVKDGNAVGKWKRKDGSEWGELSGTVQGNVIHFKWSEHKYGIVGPAADSQGTGIFSYYMGDDKIGKLTGQYAVEDADSVGEWNCVKQVGMKADLSSISGKSTDALPATQDNWQ